MRGMFSRKFTSAQIDTKVSKGKANADKQFFLPLNAQNRGLSSHTFENPKSIPIFKPRYNPMRYIVLLFLVFFSGRAAAQSITLSGVVRDKESKEVLQFASIGIKSKSVGTITNLQGEFDFHVPAEFRNEILSVSMLGYKNYEAPVWSFESLGEIVIEMERAVTVLQEVVVADSLMGGDVLRVALSRLEDNLPQKPFLLDCFYRDIKNVGGTYISLLEAAVQIYDEDSREPRNKHRLRERVKLVELRQSLGYESKFTAYFDQDNLLEDLLLNNNIRYRQIDASEDLLTVVERERDSHFDGSDVFVVSYSGGEYMFKVYIRKENYAISRFEFRLQDELEGPVIGRRKGMLGRFVGLEKVIEFKRYEDRMFVSSIRMNSKINWYDSGTGQVRFETELFQQLLVNQIDTAPKERINSVESMKKYGLQFQTYQYNKPFWDNYNVIKRTPLDRQIVADLEKAGPLEGQFEEN